MVAAQAAMPAPLLLNPDKQDYPLAGHWQLLRDASARLSVDDIANNPAHQAAFVPLAGQLSLGYSHDVIWLRFAVQRAPGAPAQWWLWAQPAIVQNLTLYVPQPAGTFSAQQAGTYTAFADRPLTLNDPVFSVTLGDQPVVMYLRMQSTSTLTLSAQWVAPALYAERKLVDSLQSGVYLGLLALSGLMSLLAALWLRQSFFYISTAYLLVLGLMHLFLQGYDNYLLGHLWPAAQQPVAARASGLLSGMLVLLHLGFVLSYLQPQAHWPRFTRALWGLAGLAGLAAVVSLAGYWAWVAPYFFALVVGVMISMVVLFVAMLPYRRGAAQLMLMMFMPGLLAASLRAMRNLGLLEMSFWTSGFWELTALLQVPFAAVVVVLRVVDVQKTMAQAQQREQAQRNFIDMMAHELRTPLAVVQTALGNLQARTATDRPDLLPRFERIDRALQRLATMVHNALVQRQLGAGLGAHGSQPAGSFSLQPVAPSALLDQVHSLVITDAAHPVSFAAVADDTPVPMDADWVALAVLNLIENAIKYSPAGGAIAVQCRHQPGHWVLEVADRGMGLPADAGNALFERFYRGEQARKLSNTSGMGLGLYLVQQVALAHGGSAHGCNRDGGGSVFTLLFPA